MWSTHDSPFTQSRIKIAWNITFVAIFPLHQFSLHICPTYERFMELIIFIYIKICKNYVLRQVTSNKGKFGEKIIFKNK